MKTSFSTSTMIVKWYENGTRDNACRQIKIATNFSTDICGGYPLLNIVIN